MKLPIQTCPICDEEFSPKAKNQVYCCKDCKAIAAKPREKEYKKDYDKGRYQLENPYKTPDFASVDGEAIKHGLFVKPNGEELVASHYVMLQSDAVKPLFADCILNPEKPIQRLGSIEIFQWLLQKGFQGKTLIGYYLNYDFENWLVDVDEESYKALLDAKEVLWKDYVLWMIPKKIFRVGLVKKDDEGNPVRKKTKDGSIKYEVIIERNVYDHSGYWQRSFVKTLDANKKLIHPDELEVIERMKGERNIFTLENAEKIAEYNQLECILLTRIAKDLFDNMAEGFRHVGIDIVPRGKDAYSPKALSVKFFKLIKWREKHPILKFQSESEFNRFKELSNGNEKNHAFPFSHAYAGGRIESFISGRVENVYGYDINSAYPKGLAMCPEWEENDLRFTDEPKEIKKLIDSRVAGMYLVEWRFPRDWTCYPFFYRNSHGNVYFPDGGKGWISCLELYAMLDTIPEKEIQKLDITACLYIQKTEQLGQVNYSENAPTESGKQWFVIYEARNQLKTIGNPGEHGAKLVYNAAYGGTIQQVGVKDWQNESTLKFFNDFVGMWITAYCRATMWLAIAPHRKNKDAIVMIQTDGVYSTVPLSVPTPKKKVLGMWEGEQMDWLENLMPGIYQYSKKGKISQKQRGWGKGFDFSIASDVLHGKREAYTIEQDAFIARGFSLHLVNELAGCALQWVKTKKDFIPSFRSKRVSPDKIVIKDGKKYFPPKPNTEYGMNHDAMCKPFNLKFTNTNHNDNMADEMFLLEHLEGNEDYHAGIEE